ncbi:oligosaccharide flippase family protein [Shewanella yunxiaonensis]|uniref:Oligosaccharide flippase family protein n=1 Tax=Shewanella yunxiaonensis TaxID=2829809 RepID=A0ABX7YXK2_9GAMM|nr:oligosaccharide flippase family protein [Shewanella yunxiaonensis]QUN06891.1 oligosaccharide flippase family protein [Shewanella yunxiaonensis]
MQENNLKKNIVAMIIVQFSNYIAPLLVFPYLTRVLGLEGFGIVAMAMSLCAIALVFIDYGFCLSAPHWLAKNKNKKDEVANYVGAVYLIKVCLFLIVSLVILFYLNITNKIPHDPALQFGLIASIFFASLQPSWFFVGIERMKHVTTFMVAAKLSYLALVFLFVKEHSQISTVFICFAISSFFASAIGFYFIYKEKYWIAFPHHSTIYIVIKNSAIFFISRLAVGLYTSASTFIIGTFVGFNAAALYSSAEKIYQAGQSVTSPVSQVLFPYLTRTGNKKVLYKTVLLLLVPLVIGVSGCIYYAENIMVLFFGTQFSDGADILRIFLVTLLFTFVSVNFGYPAFASVGRVDFANKTVIFAATIQVVSLIILYTTDNISTINLCYSILFVEFVVMLTRVCLFFVQVKIQSSTT